MARSVALVLVLATACVHFEDGTTATSATGGAGHNSPPSADCDPLQQDCPDGQACVLLDRTLECVTVALDGAEGDPCQVPTECGPGLTCVPGVYVPGCEGLSCCASFCQVSDETPECPSGATCEPALTGDDVPAALQDYGVCKLLS